MRLSIIAGTALLLASCGSRDANETAGGNQAGAPAAESSGGSESGGGGATASLSPGMYETTIETLRVNMVGGPQMPAGMTVPTPPPITVRACLTQADAARPNADFFQGGNSQVPGCAYQNFSMAGGRIEGTMTCSRDGTNMRVTMTGSFNAGGYTMEQTSQIEARGVTTETAMRMTSRRTGDCPG